MGVPLSSAVVSLYRSSNKYVKRAVGKAITNDNPQIRAIRTAILLELERPTKDLTGRTTTLYRSRLSVVRVKIDTATDASCAV